MPTIIRLLTPSDSLDELTELLHRAYARLGAMGLNYTATYQDADTTRARAAAGTCLVAEMDERLVGTVVYRAPGKSRGCAWYERPGIASFGQFAVEPELQRAGIGAALMDHIEAMARADGAEELALDTAEPATHLIAWYGRRGYRIVDHAQWEGKTYRSVIMSRIMECGDASPP